MARGGLVTSPCLQTGTCGVNGGYLSRCWRKQFVPGCRGLVHWYQNCWHFLVSDRVRRSLGLALDSHVVFSFHFRWFDGMETKKIVVWQQDGVWLGYLQEYPDYWTQGDSPEELREHLIDLYADLSGGLIDGARRVEDLVVS